MRHPRRQASQERGRGREPPCAIRRPARWRAASEWAAIDGAIVFLVAELAYVLLDWAMVVLDVTEAATIRGPEATACAAIAGILVGLLRVRVHHRRETPELSPGPALDPK